MKIDTAFGAAVAEFVCCGETHCASTTIQFSCPATGATKRMSEGFCPKCETFYNLCPDASWCSYQECPDVQEWKNGI